MSPENRRDHYRIPYPENERPRLVLGKEMCEVLDCSEHGMRFRPVGSSPPVGSECKGRLRFQHGEEIPVHAVVTRSDADSVGVRFREPGVPFGVILQEQFYLRRQSG